MNNLEYFRIWCQKILPLVYEDSLSYYEVLCKVTNKLNEVINNVNSIPEIIKEYTTEEKLKEVLTEIFNELKKVIAVANEGTSKTATEPRDIGELVWLENVLYKITRPMLPGDQYVVNSNCVVTTIEEELNSINGDITEIRTEIDNIVFPTELYNNINSMVNDDYISEGVARCIGCNTDTDNGGADYIINSDNTGNFVLTCKNNLYAHLVIKPSMNIACFNVDETGTDDISEVFSLALSLVDELVLNPTKSYKLESNIEVNNKSIRGVINSENKVPIIYTSKGFTIQYKGSNIENIYFISTNQIGVCFNLVGLEGTSSSCAENHFTNLHIDNFDKAIYYNGVVWNNVFKSIRTNFCNYGVYKNDTYSCFGNTFINFYTSGSKISNIHANKFSGIFISGIFGFSVLNGINLTQDCNVTFINSNFECDKHINEMAVGSYNSMITLSSGRFEFINCYFTPNLEANMHIFYVGAGLDLASFKGCKYLVVDNNLSVEPIYLSVSPLHYKSIVFDEGCSSFPVQIESEHRLSYNSYPYILYKWLTDLMRYYSDEYIDTNKLSSGSIQYDISRKKVTIFDGSALVDL